LKEKLTPPTVAEFQTVYQTLYKQALEYSAKPFEVLSQLKALQKNDYLQLASYGVQLSGLFALGEIVGRRQVVGYPSFGSHEEHH
jgi:F-type H+-transporting ATPase subunit g